MPAVRGVGWVGAPPFAGLELRHERTLKPLWGKGTQTQDLRVCSHRARGESGGAPAWPEAQSCRS
eukprot:1959487-Pleurochrysis_carterae.AAC.1